MVVSRPAARRPIRVLIAEDNDDLCGALKALVDIESDLECVATADNVSDVWPRATRAMADVIVLDMQLNGGSGLTVLRNRPADARTPVLVLSGYSQPQLIENVLAAGAAGYFSKAGDMDDLLAGIRRCAGSSTGH